MSDLSRARPARLFTAFGTVLYVDGVSGELRHGEVGTSPANAYFVLDQELSVPTRQGWLVYDSGTSLQRIICLEDRCQIILKAANSSSAGTMPLQLIPLERGLITLRAQDSFLSAIPDGSIKLSAKRCSTWELFLTSEEWCTYPLRHGALQGLDTWDTAGDSFDQKRIRGYVVHPRIRARINARTKARKVLIFGYIKWSHGRVNSDLSKHLYRRGYVIDILDWRANHAEYIGEIISHYDLFLTALDGVGALVNYGVPYDKIIAVSHGEFDIRMLIKDRGIEVFEQFANYGVLSEFLYCTSLVLGVKRIPTVASVGVNYAEFHSEIPEQLKTVGYATSMSLETHGVELKRGELAEAAAREAGLEFKIAGSTRNQIHFENMPDFYRTVDAVVTSSISEGAGLTVIEAAAAGRLVIGTPVGHFPRKAYEGGGIIAPVEVEKFKSFAAGTLRYYKENPQAYVHKCHEIQDAARRFDWCHVIDEWIELIETARH
jgi:glycosyltransferase involved in cell wall biosynthesis